MITTLPHPLTSRAHHAAPALRWGWRAFRSAPLTVGYLLVLTTTTTVVGSESARTDDQLLFSFSTNLHQLGRVPVRVLVGSAFWTNGWVDLALWLVLFFAVLAPVERRLGRRRTLLAFAAGHVGATLIVAAGLWIGLRFGAVAPRVVFARDVGASYGFFAVAALAGYLLAPRARVCYLALVVACVAVAAGFSPAFTDFGHLTAVAIGLACYPLARASSESRFDVRRRRGARGAERAPGHRSTGSAARPSSRPDRPSTSGSPAPVRNSQSATFRAAGVAFHIRTHSELSKPPHVGRRSWGEEPHLRERRTGDVLAVRTFLRTADARSRARAALVEPHRTRRSTSLINRCGAQWRSRDSRSPTTRHHRRFPTSRR